MVCGVAVTLARCDITLHPPQDALAKRKVRREKRRAAEATRRAAEATNTSNIRIHRDFGTTEDHLPESEQTLEEQVEVTAKVTFNTLY